MPNLIIYIIGMGFTFLVYCWLEAANNKNDDWHMAVFIGTMLWPLTLAVILLFAFLYCINKGIHRVVLAIYHFQKGCVWLKKDDNDD